MVESLGSSRMNRHCRSSLYSRYTTRLGCALHQRYVSGRRLSLCHLLCKQHHTWQDRLILIGAAFMEMLVVRYIYLAIPRERGFGIDITLLH